MFGLKSRIAMLESAGAPSAPTMIYIGDKPDEQERALAMAAMVKGCVIFVSPLDYAL